jgi:hypothetical protein
MFLSACDDPSLDRPAPPPDQVEPIEDRILLSEIILSNPLNQEVITQIDLIYNNKNLVDAINFSGLIARNYDFQYAPNNQLISFTKTESGQSVNYEITYIENTIELSHIDGVSTLVRTYYIDIQNRIARITRAIDGVIEEDLRYEYSPNFNVDRINYLDGNRSLTGFSLLTYVFNNNPFKDMNDILKFAVFEDFVPYTRFLPTTQDVYSSDRTGDTLETTISYEYNLQANNFPASRTVIRTTGGVIENTLETFIYREN